MRLLLISNSTNAGEGFLEYPVGQIREFLGPVREVLFIPYAAVTFSYDDYQSKVQARFSELGVEVRSVHRESNPARAVRAAEAVVVGGGNTFALIRAMQQQGLVQAIRERAFDGMPYIGWSAGSNVACPTICTTNDMRRSSPPDWSNSRSIRIIRTPIPTVMPAKPANSAFWNTSLRIRKLTSPDCAKGACCGSKATGCR